MLPSSAACTRWLKARRTSSSVSSLNTPALIVLLFSMAVIATSSSAENRGKDSGTVGNHLTVAGLMPTATVGTPFNTVISVSGGNAPYTFSVLWQTLPPGLTLNAITGSISGTSTTAGTYNFSIGATDLNHDHGDHRFATMVNPSSTQVSVLMMPSSATLSSGATRQFTAGVSRTSNVRVSWSTSGGSVSSSGLFTAPTVSANTTVYMTATSVADPTAKATAAVNVIPASTIGVAISPSSATIVAAATYQFTATLTGTNNTAVTWSAAAGTISSTGRFTAPSVTANTNVLVTATSVVDPAANARANVTVTPASSLPPPPPPPTGADNRYCDPGNIPNFGSDDAPAVMPTACYHTATTSTPSAGAVIQVAPGSSVSTALNSANCGDTLVLQSGQTYSGFNLPAKNCDAGHYITIRTSGYASLPAEGTRVTPCSAGVSSLPGRPAINCPSSRNVMALI